MVKILPILRSHLVVGLMAVVPFWPEGASAQTTTPTTTKTTHSGMSDNVAPRFEVEVFGGANFWSLHQDSNKNSYPAKLVTGGLGGLRLTENITGRFALEESINYGVNNLLIHSVPGTPVDKVGFGSRTLQLWAGPVFYLTPPDRQFRFFVTAGPGAFWFWPTTDATLQGRSQRYAYQNAAHLSRQLQAGAMFGGGVKGSLHRWPWLGLRADVDGMFSGQPHFHLAGVPTGPGSLYIPTGGTELGVQATAGIFLSFGRHEKEVLPPPPPPPANTFTFDVPSARTVDAGCPGDTKEPVALSVTPPSMSLPDHRPMYHWMVNGQAAGENSPNFNYTVPQTAGTYRVSVTVSDDASGAADKRTAPDVTKDVAVVTVKEYHAPTITGSASPTTLNMGDKATLTLTPQGSDCSGQLTYTCRADEGTVTGTPPNQYDSTGVTFDMANRERMQSKTVNITCTVTDTKGGTGSATIPVTVQLAAVEGYKQQADINFPSGSARVNNCGKNVLIEQVYPLLTQHPDWDVVLIGHEGDNERAARRTRGRRREQAALDRERVMNVAAILSAGKDICPGLELGRVKVVYAGKEQGSPFNSFCASSTTSKSKERPGFIISENDPDAKNRRVEIWVGPRNAKLPGAATRMEVLPEAAIRALACPK